MKTMTLSLCSWLILLAPSGAFADDARHVELTQEEIAQMIPIFNRLGVRDEPTHGDCSRQEATFESIAKGHNPARWSVEYNEGQKQELQAEEIPALLRLFDRAHVRDVLVDGITLAATATIQSSSCGVRPARWELLAVGTPAADQSSFPLPADFPVDQLEKLNAGDPVVISKEFNGIKFWLSFGKQISPRDAAALWWDVPAQTEVFGGTFRILSGALDKPRFEGEISADLPGIGTLIQRSFYSVSKSQDDVYRILVDAYSENALWRNGLGVYRFLRVGNETVYEGTSLYDNKVPPEVLNQFALGAAYAHKQRILSGVRPTQNQVRNFLKALKRGS